MYQGFMAATQAINTINSRRTAIAVDTLLEHQLSKDAADEARRRREAGLKQVVFEGAKIVHEARRVFPTSAPAALYLALRAAPIFGPAGVKDSDLPEFQDKTFHHEATRAWRDVETTAREALSGSGAVAEVEHLTWLETATPLVRRYAAWAAIADLLKGWGNTISNEDGAFSDILTVIGTRFVGLIACSIVGMFSPVLAGFLILVVLATLPKALVRAVKAPGIRKRAAAIFAEIGEPLPSSISDEIVEREVVKLREVLQPVPGFGALGAQPLPAARAREIAVELQAEHDALWRRVFSRLDDHGASVATPSMLPS